MATRTYETPLQTPEEDNETSTFVSILAGIGSGLFKIPEGLFSLGASLIDLGADTNKAAEVEKFFAKINPFDEMAEATTAGKITELIINIGIPGGIAFKVGNQLARTALLAKKGQRYLGLEGQAGVNINNEFCNFTGSCCFCHFIERIYFCKEFFYFSCFVSIST